jgi:hypothetical protein
MITACDAAISLGGLPLRAAERTFFFMELILTERGVKPLTLASREFYDKTKRQGK